MGDILKGRISIQDDDGIKPCKIEIFLPDGNDDDDDIFCVVRIPELLVGDKRIFGADKLQAEELAVRFVVQILEGRVLLDGHGNEVQAANIGNCLMRS